MEISHVTDLTYISEGNSKTECFSFDLPAIETCPGKTEECSRDCYAARLMRLYPSVGEKYKRNLEIVYHPGFVDYMVDNIPTDCQFRIHVSGDFFHPDYVAKWIEICARRPDVTFYAYTRSWRVEAIWFKIILLHDLPNVNVNLSVDDETGPPDSSIAQQMRWCYLTKEDDAPWWIREDDIVFRSNHNGRQGNHKWRRKKAIAQGLDPDVVAPLLHKIGEGTVCPFERGKDMPDAFSCAKCRLCVDKPKVLVNAY